MVINRLQAINTKVVKQLAIKLMAIKRMAIKLMAINRKLEVDNIRVNIIKVEQMTIILEPNSFLLFLVFLVSFVELCFQVQCSHLGSSPTMEFSWLFFIIFFAF